MKDKTTIIFISIFVIIVLGVGIFGFMQDGKTNSDDSTSNDSPSSEAKIEITPASHNLGNVSQKEGVVSKSFSVENTGTGDLIIDDMVSSCSCTSAALVVNDKEGPRFGMHNNPKNWSATIKPGETTDLMVYYDPNVHKDFRGSATREITLSTNDENNPEKIVKISLKQVD
ncbi:DUF1573 domain-containing protein [Patescibacteria group bacterium]|nr:DUF1573 domain-containing protein [Patescibacteria group bacterium]MBU1075621.1 DUF1573 domain-containing protein [Patescibacteria group bacterium]MBU1951879.1 DUF1573 domain-containing protein [Patescibacteria group bacterium]